jgi:alkylhydroperoxidase family enzyme
MARIEGREAGPLLNLVYRVAQRQLGGGRLPEPVTIGAHHPLLMGGYGGLELAFERSRKAPKKLKLLAEMKAAAVAGCEWCLDYGSWLSRHGGLTDDQLRDLPRFRESDAFDDDEKLVLEYAEGISKSPIEVPDELFERLRARFDEGQIVELTYAAAIENLRARVNKALGIESQEYSEGAVCAIPERPAPA